MPCRAGAAGGTVAPWDARSAWLLANLCEEAWGYGPGSSEYLHAELLAAPDLAGFTCFSWNLTDSGDTCRELRRRGERSERGT